MNSTPLQFRKQLSDLTVSDKLSESGIPGFFTAQPASDYRRTDMQFVSERIDCFDGRAKKRFASFPKRSRNERISGKAVRFCFLGVIVALVFYALVGDRDVLLRQMLPRVGELMKQGKPEAVEPVISNCNADDWSTI